jgi:Cd2+/Zn2+-exporting ATPase
MVIQTTRSHDDTTLARIVHQIEESQSRRAPVQLFVDRFARVYTPVVLSAAAAVALLPPIFLQVSFFDWVYRGLVLLIIACPCALVIATPVTLISALANAARHGILVKGGRVLETLAGVSSVAFDKTGTLTHGRPVLTDLVPVGSLPENDLLRTMAAIEHQSEHHLASAILGEAAARGLEHQDSSVRSFEAFPGRGVSATVGATPYVLGNESFAREHGLWSGLVSGLVGRLAREGKTALVFGEPGRPLAVIAVRDTLRHSGAECIAALRRLGVRHTVLISGDREESTARLAADSGIVEHRAGLLPEQKADAVKELERQWGGVAMIGDGVNDAPALASSSVGIAMGVAGSDVSLETADVVLMSDDLRKLPHLFSLGKAAMRTVRQNIVFALGLKFVFLVLAMTGQATLWMAVLADDGAAIGVILNGLRLLTHKVEIH